MNAPLWIPLVVAAVGVFGTLSAGVTGVLITQRRSDVREALAWSRQRERERDLWDREDQLRLFDSNRAACVDFYEALALFVLHAKLEGTGAQLFELSNEAFIRRQRLSIYSSKSVGEAGRVALEAAWAISMAVQNKVAINDGVGNASIDTDARLQGLLTWYDEMERELLRTIRVELGVGKVVKHDSPPIPDHP